MREIFQSRPKAMFKNLLPIFVSIAFTGCMTVTLPVPSVPHIRGQVVDAVTRRPILNAHITVNDTPARQGVSRADGTFSIADWRRWDFLTLGDRPETEFFSVTVAAPGYRQQTTQWTDETPEIVMTR